MGSEQTLFQRINHREGSFRWYRLTLHERSEDDLFHSPKVVIERGRVGQSGETIVRFFDSPAQATRYFHRKVKERLAHGYTAVDEFDELFVPECALCRLLRKRDADPCFVYEFPKSMWFLN